MVVPALGRSPWKNGVPEVWIVDAEQESVEVWKPSLEEPLRPTEAVDWAVGAS